MPESMTVAPTIPLATAAPSLLINGWRERDGIVASSEFPFAVLDTIGDEHQHEHLDPAFAYEDEDPGDGDDGYSPRRAMKKRM